MIFKTLLKLKLIEIAIEELFNGINKLKNYKAPTKLLLNELRSGMSLSEIRCGNIIFYNCIIRVYERRPVIGKGWYSLSFSYGYTSDSGKGVGGGNPMGVTLNVKELNWEFIQ